MVMEDPDDLGLASVEDMDYVEDCSDGQPDSEVESDDPENQQLPTDDAFRVLAGHKESVFCVSMDPLGKYIVSGGQDHMAIVWDLETGSQVFRTEGHQDSVTCVAFSMHGTYLATGDMAGGIRVWLRPEVVQQTWTLLHVDNVGDLMWLNWWQPSITDITKPLPAVLASGDSDGLLTFRSISTSMPNGPSKLVKYIAGSGVPALAAFFYLPSIMTDRPKLVVLYQNAELRLWDLKTEQQLTLVHLPGNENRTSFNPEQPSSVFCMACPPSKPLYTQTKEQVLVAVGGVGVVHLVVFKQVDNTDPSFTARCVSTVSTGDESSVEALEFSWTHPYLAYGTVDGTIGILDTVRFRVRQKWSYTDEDTNSVSITCLRWSHTQPVFFTSTSHGEVVAWPGLQHSTETDFSGISRSPDPLAVWRGNRSMVLDLALSIIPGPNENVEKFVVSASDDTTLRVFAIDPSVVLR